MPDREKVIRAVDSCFDYWLDKNRYLHPLELEHVRQIKADALTLLKEQETTDTNDLRVFHCKKCGYGIEDIFISDEHNYSLVPKFCPNCGRKVVEANA